MKNRLNNHFFYKDKRKQKVKYARGESVMALVALEKQYNLDQYTLKDILDEITANSPTLGGKDGVILLNKHNPDHRNWYEDDDVEYRRTIFS